MTALLFLSSLLSSPAQAGDTPKLFPAHEAGRYGFINKKGRYKIEPTFDEVRVYSEGLAAARMGDLWGYIDTKGRWVVAPTYTDAVNFSEGLAAVKQGEKVGFVNTSGALVLPPTRTGVGNFASGRALVLVDGLYGFIDVEGNETIPANLAWAEDFSDGLAPISIWGKKAGFMRTDGTVAIADKYLQVGTPSSGRIAVSEDGTSFSYIDYRGQVVIPGPFTGATDFVEGRAWVTVDERAMLIDLDGKEVPTPENTERGPFSHGLAAVRVESGLAFVTLDGELVLEGGYADALGFQGPVGLVQYGLEWRYITRSGQVVWSDPMPEVSMAAKAVAASTVGKPLLQASHWMSGSTTFTVSDVVAVMPDLLGAIDLARVNKGWEVVVEHKLDGVPCYAVYAVGDAEIYREYDLTSEAIVGWVVVEPDQTAEDLFRATFGREPAARQVDRAIADYVATEPSASDLKNIPEVHAWGTMADKPLPADLDVHLVRELLSAP